MPIKGLYDIHHIICQAKKENKHISVRRIPIKIWLDVYNISVPIFCFVIKNCTQRSIQDKIINRIRAS